MNRVFLFILLSFLNFFTEGTAQQSPLRFKAGAMVGLNMSQVEGDNQDGYRLPGLSCGLIGGVHLKPNFDISTELLYNEKGAKPKANVRDNSQNFYSDLRFQYAEAAFLANFYFAPRITESYYTKALKVGFSFGRMFRGSSNSVLNKRPLPQLDSAITSNFQRNDVSFIVALALYSTPRLGFSIRHTVSLNYLYQNKDYDLMNNKGFKFLRPYFFSVQMFYNFISPHKSLGIYQKKIKPQGNPLEDL
jgi:hypothetical protein